MTRLFTLQNWVEELLTLPTEALNARFADYGSAEKEIAALPFFSRRRWQFRRVSQTLLEELAIKIRGLDCENSIWMGILECLEDPLPEVVAHDLIDRNREVWRIGHTHQASSVLCRLADSFDETLLTLAEEIYCLDQHSTGELRVMLEKYPAPHWLLSSLVHLKASSSDKSALLEEFLQDHADSAYLLNVKREVGDKSNCVLHSKLSYLWPLSSSPTPEHLQELYGTRAPEKLKTLASDSQTPIEILEELSQIQKIPFAAEIRRRADYNLRQIEGRDE